MLKVGFRFVFFVLGHYGTRFVVRRGLSEVGGESVGRFGDLMLRWGAIESKVP